NSKFDLREMMTLDGASYDYNFALTEAAGELKVAAELCSPESGVRLTLRSTQAGLQVYTGDYLDAPFAPRQGIALEAQGFPDAANKPDFPSVRLLPGETYRQQTVYEFSLPDPRND
ncbi:MAG: galactose-1-epimerase, partial [Gammaproteobacteria bacterium]|nr:galactose-1-epimerase [Gammaproteobacteria bacterium]